jgi:hypothetical protein
VSDQPEPQPQPMPEPEQLLSQALGRIDQADLLMAERGEQMMPDDRIMFTLQTAGTLAAIAGHLADLRQSAAAPPPAEPAEWAVTGWAAPELEYTPQAVQGMRFTATLSGQYMGVAGNAEWLHVPGHGFIDVTHANELPGLDGYALSGRIVSATPDHILGICDTGSAVALPRALVTETADE